jgi:hypothetical protein
MSSDTLSTSELSSEVANIPIINSDYIKTPVITIDSSDNSITLNKYPLVKVFYYFNYTGL